MHYITSISSSYVSGLAATNYSHILYASLAGAIAKAGYRLNTYDNAYMVIGAGGAESTGDKFNTVPSGKNSPVTENLAFITVLLTGNPDPTMYTNSV